MGGYIYKYINNYSGDIVYVGKSNNQFTLINRLHHHAKNDSWSINTTVEFAAVPPDFDLIKAETAAINYYYINGITQNIHQVGEMPRDEAFDLLSKMNLSWIVISLEHLLPDDNLPKPGGIVVYMEHEALLGIYIITQVVYTSKGVVYKLFSTDYSPMPKKGLTYEELTRTSKYHYWTPELFSQVANKYGWNHVDY